MAGKRPAAPTTAEYVAGVLSGERALLGRAVTLIESDAPAHQQQAQEVLAALLPHTGGAIRVGVTGVPGGGKSSLIEALGCRLTGSGRRVAVLAVDPSSSLSRGSILGDKTRMEALARDPLAFIRPSPSGGALGGVARKTRETMLLFEAAGYEVLLVETVGIGQNETAVRALVDCFLLVLIPGAGDELQGIKRGVVELADAILINKADGEARAAALRARAEYERALRYLQPATPGWRAEVLAVSAATGEGVLEVWDLVRRFRAAGESSGALAARRREQARDWLHALLDESLRRGFRQHPGVAALLPEIERRVLAGELPVTQAAWRLLRVFAGEADA